MSDRTIVLWMIAAFAWVTPVAAQPAAPTTTAFDGTYAGVSRTVEGYQADPAAYPNSQILQSTMYLHETQHCVPNGQPGLLTIAGGVARYSTCRAGTWEGSVNAQGVLVIPGPNGERIDAQIDGRGTVTGRFTGDCSYQLVWQKES
jgi:hypothetical protein